MHLAPMTSPDVPFLELLMRARSGEPEATNSLFERFYPQVERAVHWSLASDVRLKRPWLSSRLSTGDIVQETCRSAFTKLATFEGRTEASFAAYLSMIVRNRVVDAIRFHEAERRDGRRGAHPLDPSLLASTDIGGSSDVEKRDLVERLHGLIDELPERERLLVRARFEGTATFAQLTEQLGYSSVTSARRAFFEAQARLAVRLDGAPEPNESAE